MGIELTKEQKEVRDLRNKNLLVSAAAGSGKTAVLVERIKSLINDPINPVSIDSFLIVTFTRAAAAEMRERIYKSLSGKEKSLVPYANITTIDGFCSKVLREHFNEAGISPDFTIGKEAELKILESDILDLIIEERLKTKEEDFINLCKYFTKREKLSPLKQAVFDLYNTAESAPWPNKWLLSLKKDYEITTKDHFDDCLWYKYFMEYIRRNVSDIMEEEKGLSEKYTDEYMADVNALKGLLALSDDDFLPAVSAFSFPTLRIKNIEGDIKEKARKERDALKKLFSETAVLASLDKEDYIEKLALLYPVISSFIDLTLEFKDRLIKEKHKRRIYSFSDVAHLALSVLRDENTGEITDAAREIRDSFSHVMVDEYQDSNFLQEAILGAVTRDGDSSNYFMVGDVKQSIYRFRQARPDLFTDKYDAYKDGKDYSVAIDLSRNFRSRKTVTDVVNSVFERIMTKDLGGIEYDQDQKLIFSADYYGEDLSCHKSELFLTSSSDDMFKENHIDKETAEALMIGRIIKENIIGKVTVLDGNLKRPAQYKDIVILHRAANEVSPKYTEAFKTLGLPLLSTGKKGYFDTFEINCILSYLNLLNNPYNDIALAAVLINFYGVSENDLLKIRNIRKTGNYSDAFYDLKEEFSDDYQRFFSDFNELRIHAKKKRLYEIIQEIIIKTGFDNMVRSMPGAKDRISNIDKLVDLAIKFESFGNGLFDFVNYISDIKDFDINIPVSVTAPKDSVTLMTIHKSKGLEFPICILAGSLRQIKPSDFGPEGMVISEKYGLGLDFMDISMNVKRKNIAKDAIKLFETGENRAEIIRLLYVAMTRAKEKLIITGCGNDKTIEKILENKDETISCLKRLKVQTPLELMLPGLNHMGIFATFMRGEDILKEEEKDDSLNAVPNLVKEEAIEEEGTFYPILQGKLMPKYSVSELKKEDESVDNETGDLVVSKREFTPYIPSFIEKREDNSGINYAKRGTAYHKIMEIADFSQDEDIPKLLEKSVENGYLSDIEKSSVRAKDIEIFFESDLGKRMVAANKEGNLFKERFFVMSLLSRELFSKLRFSKEEEQDKTLVQGIIDAYFIEEGKIVLMDYKTDGIGKYSPEDFGAVLCKRYKTQLGLYSLALKNALNVEVKEVYIYSFALGREIKVEI